MTGPKTFKAKKLPDLIKTLQHIQQTCGDPNEVDWYGWDDGSLTLVRDDDVEIALIEPTEYKTEDLI